MGIRMTRAWSSLLHAPGESVWTTSGAPMIELEIGGSGYVHDMIGMLATSPLSDTKALAAEIATFTGLAIHPQVNDVNEQILLARGREHMRDHQLSEYQARVKHLWEMAEEWDRNGHRYSRYDLNEYLRQLAYADHVQPQGCDTTRNVHTVRDGKDGCECGQLVRRR